MSLIKPWKQPINSLLTGLLVHIFYRLPKSEFSRVKSKERKLLQIFGRRKKFHKKGKKCFAFQPLSECGHVEWILSVTFTSTRLFYRCHDVDIQISYICIIVLVIWNCHAFGVTLCKVNFNARGFNFFEIFCIYLHMEDLNLIIYSTWQIFPHR